MFVVTLLVHRYMQLSLRIEKESRQATDPYSSGFRAASTVFSCLKKSNPLTLNLSS
jgi:hypothetical protein